MGRGEAAERSGAKNLLYGPRQLGPGPSFETFAPWDSMTSALADKRIPTRLASRLPQIAHVSDPYSFYPTGDEDGQLKTICYLSGISSNPLTVALSRERGRPTIGLNYQNYQLYDDIIPMPLDDNEKEFLATLEELLRREDCIVEFGLEDPAQVEHLIDHDDNLTLAPMHYNYPIDEIATLAELAEDEYLDQTGANLLRSASSLSELLDMPLGREAFLGAAVHNTIYFQKPLAAFRR